MTIEDVVFDGLVGGLGGGLLGGFLAGFVAYKTVQWTQAGDRRAAAEIAAEQAAVSMLRATTATARLVDQLLPRHEKIWESPMASFHVELDVQRPFLERTLAWSPVVQFERVTRLAIELEAKALTEEEWSFEQGNVEYGPDGEGPFLGEDQTHLGWNQDARNAVREAYEIATEALQAIRSAPMGASKGKSHVAESFRRVNVPPLLTDEQRRLSRRATV